MKYDKYPSGKNLEASYNTSISTDKAELQRFARLANEWYAPNGAFKVVHKFNPIRKSYIKNSIMNYFSLDELGGTPFAGLRVLDVGCGVGFLCEDLARMGATVTGIDAVYEHINIARHHAREEKLRIDYRHCLAEHVLDRDEKFDVVLNTEVIEHVPDQVQLMQDCANLLDLNGLLIIGTLNRTLRAFLVAIVGAEYVLRWLPRGTHSWKCFVRPDEIAEMVSPYGLEIRELMGVVYNPLSRKWGLSKDSSVNYILQACR